MGLSLRELKEQLITKQGYTITPAHNQLNDLKVLIDDMMNVRSASPPSSGSGSYSGTHCIGHSVESGYKLSLGDIIELDIKGCSCHTVKDTTAYCRSRTYSCSCNSNIPVCDCNGRTVTSCDCRSRTGACGSNGNCQGVWYNSDTDYGCSCMSRAWCSSEVISIPTCSCDSRTGVYCSCQNRTSSCGSRSTTSCTCNGRCACNSEKRFE